MVLANPLLAPFISSFAGPSLSLPAALLVSWLRGWRVDFLVSYAVGGLISSGRWAGAEMEFGDLPFCDTQLKGSRGDRGPVTLSEGFPQKL